jgi:hypothetical protein
MNKKEKYYNYIVDDLVKNTEIDNKQGIVKFPFLTFLFSSSTRFFKFPSTTFSFTSFSKYVQERYGTRDGEIDIILELYKERISSLIKK